MKLTTKTANQAKIVNYCCADTNNFMFLKHGMKQIKIQNCC